MPKNWGGENSKAAEARARKAAQRHAEEDRKQKEKEEEFWREDDSKVIRKLQRKDDRDKKREEELTRKKEREEMLQKELEQLNTQKATTKMTAYQLEQLRIGHAKSSETEADAAKRNIVVPDEVQENPNRMATEGEEARNVDEAIRVLHVGEEAGEQLDRHPERRVQAAYATFEEKNMPRVKAENPTLRLSQLKQVLKREWIKSPENPLNKPHASYDSKAN